MKKIIIIVFFFVTIASIFAESNSLFLIRNNIRINLGDNIEATINKLGKPINKIITGYYSYYWWDGLYISTVDNKIKSFTITSKDYSISNKISVGKTVDIDKLVTNIYYRSYEHHFSYNLKSGESGVGTDDNDIVMIYFRENDISTSMKELDLVDGETYFGLYITFIGNTKYVIQIRLAEENTGK